MSLGDSSTVGDQGAGLRGTFRSGVEGPATLATGFSQDTGFVARAFDFFAQLLSEDGIASSVLESMGLKLEAQDVEALKHAGIKAFNDMFGQNNAYDPAMAEAGMTLMKDQVVPALRSADAEPETPAPRVPTDAPVV